MTALDPASVIVRPAATVMMVRDSDEGLEVFMLRRNPASDFVAGAMVFPGGAVDPGDSAPDLLPLCAGLDDSAASAALNVPQGGLAFWVAAVRETFEESGILLAYDPDGLLVRFDDPHVHRRFTRHRSQVDAGLLPLDQLCADEQITLACDAIHYVSNWVTPIGSSRRYDTRFFVARAPAHQEGRHDDRETVDSMWIRPAAALDRADDLAIITPTASNLEVLDRFDTVDDLMAATRPPRPHEPTRRPVPAGEGATRIPLPGDPGAKGAPT